MKMRFQIICKFVDPFDCGAGLTDIVHLGASAHQLCVLQRLRERGPALLQQVSEEIVRRSIVASPIEDARKGVLQSIIRYCDHGLELDCRIGLGGRVR